MKIYHGTDSFKKLQNAVVTSGTFDGVHYGHQTILSRLQDICKKTGGESVLITYWPHPRMVLAPSDPPIQLLSSLQEKAEILEQYGLDHFLIIPFTAVFSQLSSDDFIKQYLIDTIGTRKLVIGYNHRFGKNRSGSFEALKALGPKLGFEVEEIPRQDIDHVAVSSTKIRKALSLGDVAAARQFIGRPYQLSGTVVDGDKLGRTMGFPTANLMVNFEQKLIPHDGVYAVLVQWNHKMLKGMMNIGYRPTVTGKARRLEVHIFHFNEQIYGDILTIYFMERIRDEKKFQNIEALQQQLNSDAGQAHSLLENDDKKY
jgi:riboflavin kinase / FMN adenylyltransferase